MAITATKVPLESHLFILDLLMCSSNAPGPLSAGTEMVPTPAGGSIKRR
jgi:hypothetical protein